MNNFSSDYRDYITDDILEMGLGHPTGGNVEQRGGYVHVSVGFGNANARFSFDTDGIKVWNEHGINQDVPTGDKRNRRW